MKMTNLTQRSIRVVTSLVITACYLIMLKSEFWILDDHHFIRMIDNSHLSLYQQFYGGLKQTNLFDWGSGPRWTPTLDFYYVIRAIVLKDNVWLWFALSIALINISIQALFSLIQNLHKILDLKYSLLNQLFSSILFTILFLNPIFAEVFG